MAGKHGRKPNKAGKKRRPRAKATDWMQQTIADDGSIKWILIPEREEVISTWARNGLTKEEIAEQMGTSRSTLAEWEKKCPDISDALKNARAYADARVENALFKKAVGYTVKVPREIRHKHIKYNSDGRKTEEIEDVEITMVDEYVHPELGAIAFYLKNRMPDKYRDKWPEISKDEQEQAGRIALSAFAQAVAAVMDDDEETH